MAGRDARIRCYGFFVALSIAAILIQGCASTHQVQSSVLPRGWPVPYDIAIVTSDFGAPRGSSRHEGLDLSVPKGTPVCVTADGIVSFAGRSGRYGRTIVVDHDRDYETLYAHLLTINVKRGERVRRGDVIGTVGKSGNATGFHLHYEIRLQGTAVNPRSYL